MPSPFPGMDPYLETGQLWRTLHAHLVVEICKDLQPQLLPKYVASTEERVVLGPLAEESVPDVTVRDHSRRERAAATAPRPAAAGAAVLERIEVPDLTVPHRYVTIRDTEGFAVVTVIEVLSPWNKTGDGFEDYRAKQREALLSEASLVEIDLFRRGKHTVAVPESRTGPSDYRICIHRAGRQQFGLIRFGVRDPLPDVPVPLRHDDEDAVLHLGAVFDRGYDGGAYGYKARYERDPDPPLAGEDAAWARALLRQRPGAGPAGNEGNARGGG
jgi:hypothetical protein